MNEGLPGDNDMPQQLDDILRRLADASQEQQATSPFDDVFHINAEAYPHMAEAAERITKELQILEAEERIVEATAVASSVLWPNAHDDQDTHLLDPGLKHYRIAIDPELYKKGYDELEEALIKARKSYLHTFWKETSEGLIVPSLKAAEMDYLIPFIGNTLDDPKTFHMTMTQSLLPLLAVQAKNQAPHAAETYLALRKAVEANAVGWVIDPFTVKGHKPTEVQALLGWDTTQVDLMAAVDPFDGYLDEKLMSYPYISFMPRIVGGIYGGRAITELGTRSPISQG